MLGLLIAHPGNPALAHTVKGDSFPELHGLLDRLLEEEGLASENTAIMLFSTRKRRFLYKLRVNQPMIAASNAKLATAFAALRVLSPNFRWKTHIYLVTEQDDAAGKPRQGLLVKGGGDPTLTARGMDQLVLRLKTKGLRRVSGALYYDESLFDDERYPAAWGSAIAGQSWFAPVSPYIVEKNAAAFFVNVSGNGDGIEVIPQYPAEFVDVHSQLKIGPVARAVLKVRQTWGDKQGLFVFEGKVPATPHTYTVSTAVTDPVAYFFHHLRASLHKLGIRGTMPLRPLPEKGLRKKLLHTNYSPPLRDLMFEVNKESNNLTAEVILRALALTKKSRRVSGKDGLAVLNAALLEDFEQFRGQVHLADGSGLSRDTRLTASFLVHLLSRVLRHPEFRSEFVSSLSLVGWDGTMRYRHYPEPVRGRIRAKSGTLSGVQNLSGYLNLTRDVVVFSFLINDSKKNFLQLQKAQDRTLAGIYLYLLAQETTSTSKTAQDGKR